MIQLRSSGTWPSLNNTPKRSRGSPTKGTTSSWTVISSKSSVIIKGIAEIEPIATERDDSTIETKVVLT